VSWQLLHAGLSCHLLKTRVNGADESLSTIALWLLQILKDATLRAYRKRCAECFAQRHKVGCFYCCFEYSRHKSSIMYRRQQNYNVSIGYLTCIVRVCVQVACRALCNVLCDERSPTALVLVVQCSPRNPPPSAVHLKVQTRQHIREFALDLGIFRSFTALESWPSQ
jgi:hypothetical protein